MDIELIPYTQNDFESVSRMFAADSTNTFFFSRLLRDLYRGCRLITVDGETSGVVFRARNGTTNYCIIFIKMEMRRKGIATNVLHMVESEFPDTILELSSFFNIEDETAIGFAEKHGFTRSFDSVYMMYNGERPEAYEIPVRKYRDEDYCEAQKMYAEAFHRMRVQVGDFPDSVPAAQSEAGRNAWKNDADNYFVYEENGEIIGVGHLCDDEISSVSVRIDKQRQGIGRKFVHYLMNRIYDRGYSNVALECVVGNPARRLYDEIGFSTVYTERFVRKMIK